MDFYNQAYQATPPTQTGDLAWIPHPGGRSASRRLGTWTAPKSCCGSFPCRLFAHHGNAEFNTEKTVTVKGTVTEMFWANPHCFLKFDEKADGGDVRHWVVETSKSSGYSGQQWLEQVLFQTGRRSYRHHASSQRPQATHWPYGESCAREWQGIGDGRGDTGATKSGNVPK